LNNYITGFGDNAKRYLLSSIIVSLRI